MTRALLVPPLSETPAVDFRNSAVGTITAGATVSAAGQFYTWTSAGLNLGFTSALGAGNEGTSARWFPPSALDWSNTDYVYIEAEWPVNAFSPYLQVFIGADAGATFTNYLQTTSLGAGVTKTQTRAVFAFRLSECSRFGTATTDVKNVTRSIQKVEIRLRASSDITNPLTVTVHRIWTTQARSKCVITYDNIFASVHSTAWGAATSTGWRAAGLKGVMYMSATDLADVGNSMTAPQVQAVYADGWDMGLQNSDDSLSIYCNKALAGSLTSVGTTATWVNVGNVAHNLTPGMTTTITGATQPQYNGTFPVATTPNAWTFTYTMLSAPGVSPATGALVTCPRPGYSLQEIVADVANSKGVAQANGWTRGNEFFAYSQGVYSTDVFAAMEAAGIYLTRTADSGPATQVKAFDLRLGSVASRHSLPAIIMDGRTAAAVLADIDAAIRLGSSFALLGHGVQTVGDSLNMATAEFTQLVVGVKQRVNQGLMDVVTMTQLRQQMQNGRAFPA